jgi:FkbM family methyltransferase
MFKEYVSHRLIGTPLEPVALSLRRLATSWKQFRHPELHDVHLEATYMKQVMDRAIRESTNCIDIGCHLGSMLQHIQHCAKRGQHMGIEPVPYKAQWLQRKFPHIEILPFALGDQDGDVEFFVTVRRSAYSGLRYHGSHAEKCQRFKVSCKRLDDIVPPNRDIGFIKLDAEGGELNVLQGGQALIRRCRPVIIFYSTQLSLKAFQIDPKSVFDAFTQQFDYSVFTLKRWLAGQQPLTCDAFVQAMYYPFQAFRFLAIPNRAPTSR